MSANASCPHYTEKGAEKGQPSVWFHLPRQCKCFLVRNLPRNFISSSCIGNQNWSVLSDDQPGQAGKVGDGMTARQRPRPSQGLRLTTVHHLGPGMLSKEIMGKIGILYGTKRHRMFIYILN